MFELTIKGEVYQFNFGMGFLREINKFAKTPVEGVKGLEQGVGLRYRVGGLLDGDPEALVDVLDIANKTEKPRVTRAMLDSYIDSLETDIAALFAEVLDFLSESNATKKVTAELKEMAELEEMKKEAQIAEVKAAIQKK